MRNEPIHLVEQLNTQIEKSVLAYCVQAGLFPHVSHPNGRSVCVAVSGGADSMALLRILLVLAPQLDLQVQACHVNHGIRGETANRDEAFVRQQCAGLGVPLTVYNADADGVCVPEKAGEDWARQLRYGYFDQQLKSGTRWIATAHTGSDQAETLLFRLARGTGPHGAAGIRPVRGPYVRPLLCLTRQEVEAYCAAVKQPFVTDETNLTDAYARNRIRQQAVPALEQANAAAVRNLCAFCDRMDRIDAYFSAQAAALLQTAADKAGGSKEQGPWSLETLRQAEPLILETALHRLVSPIRDPEEKYIRLLQQCVHTGGAVQLRDDIRFVVSDGQLYISQENTIKLKMPLVPEYPLAPGEYAFPGGFRVRISVLSRQEWENIHCVHKKDLKNVADYARIPMLTSLRTRRSGDRFHQAGRSGGKSLKKLQNEEATPQDLRYRVPLAAQGSEVLWLWEHGFSEGLAPDKKTELLLRVEEQWQEEDNS